jgi:hypothetical protein
MQVQRIVKEGESTFLELGDRNSIFAAFTRHIENTTGPNQDKLPPLVAEDRGWAYRINMPNPLNLFCLRIGKARNPVVASTANTLLTLPTPLGHKPKA